LVLALGVCGSLGLLAWTLGFGSAAAVRHARREVSDARIRLADVERRMQARSAAIHDSLARLQGDR
jgi:hypothetical protein